MADDEGAHPALTMWRVRSEHAVVEAAGDAVVIRVGGVTCTLAEPAARSRIEPLSVALRSGHDVHVAPDRAVVSIGGADATMRFDGDIVTDGSRLLVRSSNGAVIVAAHPAEALVLEDGVVRLGRAGLADACMVIGALDPATNQPDGRVGAVLRDPAAVERLGRSALARHARETLRFTCAEAAIGDAVTLASARLAFAPATRHPPTTAWRVLGALAVCDLARAAEALDALVDSASPTDRFDASLAVLLSARVLAATGDIARASDTWRTVQPALESLLAPPLDHDCAVVSSALAGAAVVAETLGDGTRAAVLASAARHARTRPPDRGHHAIEAHSALARALEPREGEPLDAEHASLVARAAAIRAGEPWLDNALAGFLVDTARLVGVVPDASRHRLRLRPGPARDALPVSASGIRMGDAEVEMRIAMEGSDWRVQVRQTRGPIPITMVLEAAVPWPAFDNVRVDGRPATLDARPLGAGWEIPVQLVLDAPRTLELTLRG